jgi:hypothetical protein
MSFRKWGRWLLGIGFLAYCSVAIVHSVMFYTLARKHIAASAQGMSSAYLDDQARQYAIVLLIKYAAGLVPFVLVMLMISWMIGGFGANRNLRRVDPD